ncbi:response regulator transcription factor [Paenibacillus agaridevorans]|uniref:response regulator transcription factor n=1 Tax=Paenibacillus agaridevorans TaxID=171404 RepID=UPI001BE472EB|nr:helix-turn-helix domain-containing protein [Paenibacillus agaridevorans]
MNVLIVDDQRLSRSRLIQLVDWQGLGIKLAGEAANGQEALEKIGDTDADLILTDVRMPIMNGLLLIEKAREQYGDDIGFIVTSGYDEFEYVRQSLRLTVADYLLKPVDGGELNAVLSRIVEARREQTARQEAQLRHRQEQWLYYVVEGVFEGDTALMEAEAADAGFAETGRAYAVAALEPDAGLGADVLAGTLPAEAVRIVIRTRGVWLAAIALPAENADDAGSRCRAAGLTISSFEDKLAEWPRLIRETIGRTAGDGVSRSTYAQTDGQTVGLSDGQTSGQSDGQTDGIFAGARGGTPANRGTEADSSGGYGGIGAERPDVGMPDIRQAMLEMKAYIDGHFRESLTLTELAKRLYISPGYFCSLFRQATGVNYLEYIASLRMDFAKRLLTEDPSRRINEVAELCGYQDLKYFRKLFKRHHGMTPMKLKEEAQGGSLA